MAHGLIITPTSLSGAARRVRGEDAAPRPRGLSPPAAVTVELTDHGQVQHWAQTRGRELLAQNLWTYVRTARWPLRHTSRRVACGRAVYPIPIGPGHRDHAGLRRAHAPDATRAPRPRAALDRTNSSSGSGTMGRSPLHYAPRPAHRAPHSAHSASVTAAPRPAQPPCVRGRTRQRSDLQLTSSKEKKKFPKRSKFLCSSQVIILKFRNYFLFYHVIRFL